MQTPLAPIMDNLYLDTYYFFVPNRLVWEHWKQFNGENTESAWLPQTEYSIPQITAPADTGWTVGTIADYFGIPTGVPGISVNALPFRAYALICNEWFRDQNLCDPLNIPVSDATVVGVNTDTFVTDVAKGGKPYKAAKFRDYFTSCLPSPQKGPDVGLSLSGTFDVVPDGNLPTLVAGSESYKMTTFNSNEYIHLSPMPSITADLNWLDPGLKVDLAGANMITINSLRLAFQLQKLYEKDARGGTRYIEILKAHFGVTSPDSRLQRPEYLGGNRIPINIDQVVQTSGTVTGSTPQGNTAAYSLTTDYHSDFTQSFVEHGFVIGLMVARYDHTYQQGLARQWSRKTRFDYYWPVLANIGEQAVLNKEIYCDGSVKDNEVFGYQEAWADYRYKPSLCTGEMRSTYAQSLDVWHLGDDYETLPKLSASWIQEDKSVVDRVLAVTSDKANQLFADIYIKNTTTRPMPLYSIPGLIDHH
nr:MAG: major capsid protein [Microviridae sp.]